MRLGTLLIREGMIRRDQLEEGLRAQILFGGKLGTNLVQIGVITIQQLSICLGKLLGIDEASEDEFDNVSDEVIAKLPLEVAEETIAFPIAMQGSVLVVAISTPNDPAVLCRIEQATGMGIIPKVAPELRIRRYLEKRYQIVRPPQYMRIALRNFEPTPVPKEKERREVIVTTRGKKRPSVRIEPILPKSLPLAELSVNSAQQKLGSAGSREEAINILREFSRQRAHAGALFFLRQENLFGVFGFALQDNLAIEHVLISIDQTTLPAQAINNKTEVLGPLDVLSGGDQALLALPGFRTSENVLLIPITLGNRVVNLLLVQSENTNDDVRNEFRQVCDALANSYVRLIQKSKKD